MNSSDYQEFETPENVVVRYPLAGMGTRFLAWFVDIIIVWVALIVLLIILLFGSAGLSNFAEDVLKNIENFNENNIKNIPFYVMGVFTLIAGLGSFIYFGFFELLMKGQTPGKRYCKIRVVNAQGFSLNPGSVLIRNIFRVIEHYPLFWITPVISKRSQRFGDMVARTLVVKDNVNKMDNMKEQLLKRDPAERVFSFSNSVLQKVKKEDVQTVETLLKRWSGIKKDQREILSAKICRAIAEKLKVQMPLKEKRLVFFKDFLASYYQRQYRQLD